MNATYAQAHVHMYLHYGAYYMYYYVNYIYGRLNIIRNVLIN